MQEKSGWSGFFGTVALTGVLLASGMGLLAGYFIGHFSHPKEKTVTIARAGLPGIPLRGTSTIASQAPAATPAPEPSPAPAAPAAPETTTPDTDTATATSTTPAEPSTGKTPDAGGKEIFTTNCASCHTLAAAGSSGTVGPNLDQLKDDQKAVAKQVTNGGGAMPAFGKNKLLNAQQIQMVATYVAQVAGSKP
jgi:mono/diheme cytochrome c family protein